MKYLVILFVVGFLLSANVAQAAKPVESDNVQSTAKKKTDKKKQRHYSAEIVPENMTVQEKKKRFRYLLVPAVKKIYSELHQQYLSVRQSVKSGTDSDKIKKLIKEYKAKNADDLLVRLKPHPVSIVLAQAAMESSWATSRFFIKGKNIFGVWSFNKKEPRIAAAKKRGNKTIWLKKYKTIEEAVRDNYKVLARGRAFSKFRQLRMKSNNPFELVKGLDKYSEMGKKYTKELASVIRYNKFNKYDIHVE